jgi:hypothetical protein
VTRPLLVAVATALALTPTGASRESGDAVEMTMHTSGQCRHEAQLVTDALQRSATHADIDGDGRLDAVAVVTDENAGRRCRGFAAVDLRRGPTYSTALDRSAVPPRGMVAELAGVTGDDLRFRGPTMTTRTVPADRLTTEFPEFGSPHFDACPPR